MSDMTTLWVLGSATMATALVAGVFLTFSDFAMRSFAASTVEAGAEVMQVLNRVIYRSIFMVLLLGMVPAAIGLLIMAIFAVQGMAAKAVLIGVVLYLVGVFLVTVVGNVPMNKRLDAASLSDGTAQAYWKTYRVKWTLLNHLRTAASAGAAASFGVATILVALAM